MGREWEKRLVWNVLKGRARRIVVVVVVVVEGEVERLL